VRYRCVGGLRRSLQDGLYEILWGRGFCPAELPGAGKGLEFAPPGSGRNEKLMIGKTSGQVDPAARILKV
jgi:hypothetical protein